MLNMSPFSYGCTTEDKVDIFNQDVPVEHLDEESVISDSSEEDISDKSEEIRKFRSKQAYSEFDKKHRKDIKNMTSAVAETVPLMAAADVSQLSAVNNYDFTSGNVMDISTSLAVVEVKKRMKKLAQSDGKKQKRVKERLSYHGNRFGIGNDSRQEEINDKNEKIVTEKQQEKHSGQHGISRLGNSHKIQEEKPEYAKKERAKEIKNKRKELFLNENREIAGTVYSSEPKKVNPAKIYLKKESSFCTDRRRCAYYDNSGACIYFNLRYNTCLFRLVIAV